MYVEHHTKYVLVVNGGHEVFLNSIHCFFLLFFVHGAKERVSGEPFSSGLHRINKVRKHSKQTFAGRVPFLAACIGMGLCIEFLVSDGVKCNLNG